MKYRQQMRYMLKMRERSGDVHIDDLLTSFLYELMRDHVTPGTVEQIMLNTTESKVTYSNGWLARYANDVANRLCRKPRTKKKR